MFGLNRELFAPTAGLTYPTRTVLSPPVRVHVVGLVQAITPDYQNSWLRFKGASLPPVSSLRLHPLLASIKLARALVSLACPQCIESKSLFGHFAGIWIFLSCWQHTFSMKCYVADGSNSQEEKIYTDFVNIPPKKFKNATQSFLFAEKRKFFHLD